MPPPSRLEETHLGDGAEVEIFELGYLRDDVEMIIAQFFDGISVQSQAHQLGQIRQLVHLHHVRDGVPVQVEHLEVGELQHLGVDGGERVEGEVEPSQRLRFHQQRVEGLRGSDQRLDLVVVDA